MYSNLGYRSLLTDYDLDQAHTDIWRLDIQHRLFRRIQDPKSKY